MSERAEDQQAPADVTRALLRVAQYYDERDQDGTPVFPGASDVVPDYPPAGPPGPPHRRPGGAGSAAAPQDYPAARRRYPGLAHSARLRDQNPAGTRLDADYVAGHPGEQAVQGYPDRVAAPGGPAPWHAPASDTRNRQQAPASLAEQRQPAPQASGYQAAAPEPAGHAQAGRRGRRGAGGLLPGIGSGQHPVPPPRRGRRPAPDHDPGIAAQAIYGNLVITAGNVSAWFVLPPEPWSFRSPADRESKITAHAARLAQLVGRRCFIRVTSRPFPVRDWAISLDQSVRGKHPVMPGPCPRHPHRSEQGCPTCVPGHAWFDWLGEQQRRVHHWGTDDKVVYLGVELEGRGGLGRLIAQASRRAAAAELSGFADRLREVSAAVTGAGLRGIPASPGEMRWLLARSCWLHMPAPRTVSERKDAIPYALPDSAPLTMDRSALTQFTEGFTATAVPFGRTVTITRSDGLTRHVAVLTVADGWPGEDPPWDSPWLQRTDLLPFPVEWAVTIDIRHRKAVAADMDRRIKEIKHQAGHYGEHGQPMPPAMERQFADARRLEDEQQHSPQAMSGRAEVWARVAVGGQTEAEALARAGQVAELYSPGIPIVHPPDQYALTREFIPGEPLSSVAHCRRIPAKLLAAGMPNATARIGRRDGFPIGRTASLAARSVTLHPWLEMEEPDKNKSGLIVVTGTLGSGKSTFGGLMAYMAVRAGIPTVIMDPSGLLDQLCGIPELAAHSRAVNLLESPAGTLCPYGLIADPRREDFDFDDRGQRADLAAADDQWQKAREAAAVQRRELAKEVLRMLLPAEMRGKEATATLSKAAAMVPSIETASPRDVLAAMRGIGDDYGVGHTGVWLADQLEELTSHPWARLFFPSGDAATGDVTAAGRLLTVMTLRGLVVPDRDIPPERYTTEQRLTEPLMHLAAWLARRHVMDRPRHTRKLTILDEAHNFTRGPIGQALVNETSRDSRKHNHCAIFMSQLPQDLQISQVDNLIGMAMAGRTDGAEEQAATLRFLNLPVGHGYERTLSGLSRGDAKGQFMVYDGSNVEVIQVDLAGCSEALRHALDSTPTGRPPARFPATPSAAAATMPYLTGEAAS